MTMLGTNRALFLAALVIDEPGDEVTVSSPSRPEHTEAALAA